MITADVISTIAQMRSDARLLDIAVLGLCLAGMAALKRDEMGPCFLGARGSSSGLPGRLEVAASEPHALRDPYTLGTGLFASACPYRLVCGYGPRQRSAYGAQRNSGPISSSEKAVVVIVGVFVRTCAVTWNLIRRWE